MISLVSTSIRSLLPQRLAITTWSIYLLLLVMLAMPTENAVATPNAALKSTEQTTTSSGSIPVSLEQQIAQKIMLDLRNYCGNHFKKPQDTCRTPLTQLPSELAELIADTDLGGVILFADNLVELEQIVKLNYDLQSAAAKSSLGAPLFLSIDQEGGRVARVPRQFSTAFTGAMSIGATYQKQGTKYATQVADVLATEVLALGFNTNHAPTVDVNINPNNPVINVRSFSEDPTVVSILGAAQVKAFQDQGLIANIKHFPGHGDTNVDSHTGLPRVNHNLATIEAVDLAPFAHIIKENSPGMIMTAHIQYPKLDNSTFTSKDGKVMIKPATMSRKIMQKLLREKMGYQGIIITDALDMAGIAHYFNETEAVVNTFAAGVDIALMPLKIHNKAQLHKLPDLINAVAEQVRSGKLDSSEITSSFERIQKVKANFELHRFINKSLEQRLAHANKVVGSDAHRVVEKNLALAAITLIKGDEKQIKTMMNNAQHISVIMPDMSKCLALTQALAKRQPPAAKTHCTSLQAFDKQQTQTQISRADLVIAGHIAPKQSAVEMGGMDDLNKLKNKQLNYSQQKMALEQLMRFAKQKQKPIIFTSLRAPYETANFGQYADVVLATYAYNVETDKTAGTVTGPAFTALAAVIAGKAKAEGNLPVTIRIKSATNTADKSASAAH